MPEVPQNIDQILPAARDQARRVVAHLTRLSDDLTSGTLRRGDSSHAPGGVLLSDAIGALQRLADAIDRGDPAGPRA